MNRPAQTLKSPRTWLAAGVYLASATAGLVMGYDFGLRAGGLWLGVVAAANGAIFCTILADALVSALGKGTDRRQQQPES